MADDNGGTGGAEGGTGTDDGKGKEGTGDEGAGDNQSTSTSTDSTDWKAQARKWEREAKKAADAAEKLRKENQSEAEKALDKARLEGEEKARKEVGPELAKARLELSVLRSVGAKFADPADALRFIDAADVQSDDGTVDDKALAKAVDVLLEQKPYLAAVAGDGTTRVPVGARGGQQSGGDMNSLIRRAAGR